MSISRNKQEDTDIEFSNIVYDHAQTAEASKSTVEKHRGQEPAEATEMKQSAASPEAKKSGYLIDVLLVIMLLLMVGAGGYYIKIKMDEYRVPTEYEKASAEYNSLQAEFNLLSADKQTVTVEKIQQINALQSKLETLNKDLEISKAWLKEVKEKKEELQNNIQKEKQAIDRDRYQLRNNDDTYRDKALAKLPGLQLQVVTNRKTKEELKNVYIEKVEFKNKKRVLHIKSIKQEDGVDKRWEVKDLIKDQLPAILRYALGYADFVDMSILDEPGDKKKARKRPVIDRTAPVSANRTTAGEGYGYYSTEGSPTIINSHTDTISADPTASPEYEPLEDPVWQAPDGALPINF